MQAECLEDAPLDTWNRKFGKAIRQDSPPEVVVLCANTGCGGMERVVMNLATELKIRRFPVRVILPSDKWAPQMCRWFAANGVSTQTASALQPAMGRRRLPGVFALADLLRRDTPDAPVVNAHYGMNFPPLSDITAIRLAGKRCVVSLHTGGGADPPARTQRIRKTRLAARLCDAVVAVSAFQAENLVQGGVPRSKIHIISGGVALPVPDQPGQIKARAALGIPANAFVIVTAARLTARKGIDDLIRAVAALSEDPIQGLPGLFLAVAGDGGERDKWQALAEKLLPDRCRFLGFVCDMDTLYAAADLFVLPSREESFGLVYAEAALRGLPSIGLSIGGVPEVILDGKTGLLVPPGGGGARLTEAIQTLRDDPCLRAQMGEAARQYVRTRFTAESATTKYLQVLFPKPH